VDYVGVKSALEGPIRAKRGDDPLSFVGKASQLIPVKESFKLAGVPLRVDDETGKEYAVAGTSGHLWAPAEMVSDVNDIDMSYFDKLVDDSIEKIETYGPYEDLVG